MITLDRIKHYRGATIRTEINCLYIPPHPLLRSHISHYTLSFPTPHTMSDEYTVLPSASSTLCIFADNGKIISTLNGTNTRADKVGSYANKMNLLLLIKFRAGGFYPFYHFTQSELTDSSLALNDMDKKLTLEIENKLLTSECIESLVEALNTIFINRLKEYCSMNYVTAIINKIIVQNGNVNMKELSSEFFYSEKHIRRLFLQHVGTTPKMFSRIVRVNQALCLLQNIDRRYTQVAVQMGYFDQAHFIHDFKIIFGLTPQKYICNMSDFYNDEL